MYIKSQSLFKRIDWTNALFLGGAHIAAIAGFWFLWVTDGFRWPTIVLALIMGIGAGLGITVGYHRLFAHKAYQAHWSVKLFLLLFGAAAFQNAARLWASDHRRHHKYVDTDRDPYNIKEGFLFAHIGWVLLKYDDTIKYDDVPDLDSDPLVKFQEKYYAPLAVGMGLLLPTLLAWTWGDPVGGFILAGWVRIVLNEHFTFSINSFSHMFGTQPYNDTDSSRDNWFFALFTYGEGYHNFHHKFPFDYRNAIKYHQWDPSKWLIKALSWVGLTRGLKKAPKEVILMARLKMDEKRIIQKLDGTFEPEQPITKELVASARVKFEKAYVRFQEVKNQYMHLRKEKMDALQSQINNLNVKIEDIKKELGTAKAALEEAMATWGEICGGLGVTATRASV